MYECTTWFVVLLPFMVLFGTIGISTPSVVSIIVSPFVSAPLSVYVSFPFASSNVFLVTCNFTEYTIGISLVLFVSVALKVLVQLCPGNTLLTSIFAPWLNEIAKPDTALMLTFEVESCETVAAKYAYTPPAPNAKASIYKCRR